MAHRGRGRPGHPDVLTPGEWSVLDMWRHGLSRRAVAERRGVSPDGIRYHLGNIVGKLGVDSSHELRKWPGFPMDSARATRRIDRMDQPLQLGPLGQVSLLTRSAPRAQTCYAETLGLPHVFTFGDLVFFDCGGTRLYIRQVPDDQWRAGSILYFLVPEIESAARELSERGVPFQGAPHMIFRDDATGIEEWMAFFEDPDGNTLAVMSRVAPEVGTAALG